MSSKFRKEIVMRVRQEKRTDREQEHLKEKYQVDPEQDILIVEKSNMAKFLIRTIGRMVRLAANILCFVLAIVGAAAILYPGTRTQLLQQLDSIWNQVMALLPVK